jgi:hypothetical protein
VAYYEGDGSTTDFFVPDEPQPGTSADITNTEVWKNGIALSAATEFFMSTTLGGKRTVTITNAPAVGDVIAVVFKFGHDYELDGSGKLVLQSGWNGADSTIDAESIVVTTFSNHDTQKLRTEVFKGSDGSLNINIQDRGTIGVTLNIFEEDFGDVSATGDSVTATEDRGTIIDSDVVVSNLGLITEDTFSTTVVDNITATTDLGDLGVLTTASEDFGSVVTTVLVPNIVAKRYRLSQTPLNSSYVFVAVNKINLTANHDYRLEDDEVVIPLRNLTDSDVILITYVGGAVSKPSIAYRIFKDIINRYHYKRISIDHSTFLTADVPIDATEINVSDATKLGDPQLTTNTPGIIFIGTERIAYFDKDGNTLKRLFRGTLGTAVQSHSKNAKVVDASAVQTMPYEDTENTTTFTSDGSTVSFALSYLPSTKNELTVLVGGEATNLYSIGSDSTTAIVLDSAPASGVLIRVVRKTGSVWYNQGSSSAADGLGLQQSTNVNIAFLQDKPADLTLI